MNGRRRLHSDSSHTSHTSDHTTSSGAEGQAGECAGDFSIVSTLWADSAGCYADFGESVYEYVGAEGTYMIAPIPLYNSADSPVRFVFSEQKGGGGMKGARTLPDGRIAARGFRLERGVSGGRVVHTCFRPLLPLQVYCVFG